MTVTIRNKHNEILNQSKTSPEHDARLHAYNERFYHTVLPFWQCMAQEYSLGGMHIGLHQAKVFEKIHISSSEAAPVLSMLFVEQGDMEVETGYRGTARTFSSNQHNLIFDAYSTDCTTMPEQETLRLSILSFYPEYFLKLAEGNGRIMEMMANKVAANKSWSLCETANAFQTGRMQIILNDIRRPPVSGSARRIFLESKMLEILALQLEQFENADSTASVPGKTDTAKLYMAKELIEGSIDHPHTLASIARATGLNEYKLKSGFKALFGKPVFEYLRDLKLSRAFEETVSSDKPLGQIASEIGFSSPQHFSLAFKQKFGVSPMLLRKK